MKDTYRFFLLIVLALLLLKSVLSKDPVSDFDLAWTMHNMGDSNQDGVLEEPEIARFYQREIQFPSELADFVAKSLLARGDTNHDNGLTLDETILAMASVRY